MPARSRSTWSAWRRATARGAVRPAFETAPGKPCEVDREADGTQACEVKVRDKGTALLAGESKTQMLLACACKDEK